MTPFAVVVAVLILGAFSTCLVALLSIYSPVEIFGPRPRYKRTPQ